MQKLNIGSLVIAMLFATVSHADALQQKPNIVFIMADDLGPGWVDYDGGNQQVHTPNLQRLAETGMVFNRAYAAASICSPTRAACITGMSPAQLGLTTHVPGKAGNERKGPPGSPAGADSLKHLPLDCPSYASELKKLGYVTGFIGKWHLAGEGSTKTKDGVINAAWHPEHYGFDSNIGGCAYGQPKSWFDPYRNATIQNRTKGEYLTDRLGDEAVKFIKNNKDTPFHLTLWPYSVHSPIRAPKDLIQKNDGRKFNAMIECLDNAVGKVIEALKMTGTLDNTLLVFYSDNGGAVRTEWLADKKGSLLEGGLRVPMVVSWPGVIKPGTSCNTHVTSMDFFPTFVHAAGGSTDQIKQLEGLDLKPLFVDGSHQLDRDALVWHFPHNRPDVSYYMGSTIVKGDWKYYQGYGLIEDALFNLRDDPMEKYNVLTDNLNVVENMKSELDQWLTKVSAKMPKPPKKKQN